MEAFIKEEVFELTKYDEMGQPCIAPRETEKRSCRAEGTAGPEAATSGAMLHVLQPGEDADKLTLKLSFRVWV